ncbi:MAG: hypothetical protein AAFU65_00220 [Pseudomonadota bacterium]
MSRDQGCSGGPPGAVLAVISDLWRRLTRQSEAGLYLGDVFVVPPSLLSTVFVAGVPSGVESKRISDDIRVWLDLPAPPHRHEAAKRDLVIDLALEKFHGGGVTDFIYNGSGATLFWRPRIRVAARVSRLHSGKYVTTIRKTRKMSWREYGGRLLRWRVYCGLDSVAPPEEMRHVLGKTLLDVFEEARRKV